MHRRASGPAAWVMARVLAQGLEFLAWVVLARSLGAGAVGVLAATSMVARLLGLVGDWGASFRGPRDVVREGRDSALVASFVARRELASLVLAAALAGVLVGLAEWHLLPVALMVLGRGANRDWIALGEERRTAAAAPLLLQGAVAVVLVSATASTLGGASALAAGSLVGLAASVALNPLRTRRSFTRVSVDAWYLMAGIADQVLVSGDTVLLLLLDSSASAGIYTSVYRLPLAWITVVGLATTAAVPMIARALRTGNVDAARLHRRADRVALAATLAVLPVALVGIALIGPIFGDDFELGRTALIILFAATALTTMSAPYRALYTSMGPDRTVGLVTAVAATVNVVANLAVIPTYGMEGAAATTLATQLGMTVFFCTWSLRERSRVVTDGGVMTAASELA